MKWSSRLPQCDRDGAGFGKPARDEMESIQGTIQRVDYRRRELWVIALGQVWEFVVSEDCRLWFNGTPAILRCFHPLDPVVVIFGRYSAESVAKVLYSWEP
jgi:hypothetical protein